VAIIIWVEDLARITTFDAENVENFWIGEVAFLFVDIRRKLILDMEFEILEQVSVLEELVLPVNRWCQLRIVKHRHHATGA